MRFKKLIVMLSLLGITILYDVDARIGGVWRNNATTDCTIMVYRSQNLAVFYSSDGKISKMTFEEFANEYGLETVKNIAQGDAIILKRPNIPAAKEAPGLKY